MRRVARLQRRPELDGRFPPASKSGLAAAFIFPWGDPRLYELRRASLEPSDCE
jgi:hypothetical protein